MSKQNPSVKIQTYILRVNIDCKGCARKVTKLLQKIKGVYFVSIDAEEQGNVTVASNVDPAIVIQKLKKSGKHAELWESNNNNQNEHLISNHFSQLVDSNNNNNNSKGGKNGKSKNQNGGHTVAHFVNMEGPPTPAAHRVVPPMKAVPFNLPDDYHSHDHQFYYDSYDDDDDHNEEEGSYVGHGQYPIPIDYYNNNNKVMPMMMMGNRAAGPRGPAGQIIRPVVMKNPQKGGGGGGGNEDGVGNGGGDTKKKNGGRFLSFGKKKNKGPAVVTCNFNGIIEEEKNGHGELAAGVHGKKSSSKNKHNHIGDYYADDNVNNMHSHHGENSGKNHSKCSSNGNVNGSMNGGGGYRKQQHQGMQQHPPPYCSNIEQEQQQYMAMMNQRKQQQANINNMYQPPQTMMYGGRQQPSSVNMYQPPQTMIYGGRQQPPSVNNYYIPPPPMPSHPNADPITHTLSEDNPNACTIM